MLRTVHLRVLLDGLVAFNQYIVLESRISTHIRILGKVGVAADVQIVCQRGVSTYVQVIIDVGILIDLDIVIHVHRPTQIGGAIHVQVACLFKRREGKEGMGRERGGAQQ